MKVLMLNGSSNLYGCTYTALLEVGQTLKENGIDYEIFQLGGTPIRDCIGCNKCSGNGCIFTDDKVNEFREKAAEADAFIFGTPVYYSHPSGRVLSFLDRVFYSGSEIFSFKPGAAIASARRAGTSASLDVMNKYFAPCRMLMVGSTYWNEVHGFTPEDVHKDEEGMQTMRNLARNMAWLLNCLEAGKKSGSSHQCWSGANIPISLEGQKMNKNMILPFLGLCLVGCSSAQSASSYSGAASSSSGQNSSSSSTEEKEAFDDTLIIFLSRAGENWQVGNVEKGNTEVIVDYIKEEYEIDSFKIEPVTPYPEDYHDMLDVVREEQAADARPDYIGQIENFAHYKNIILGYPIYNGTLPNIVLSLLDDYDFSNKTIYPFSTHGGSGLGDTISRLEELEPNATISTSFSISGSQVRNEGSKERIISWIRSLPL